MIKTIPPPVDTVTKQVNNFNLAVTNTRYLQYFLYWSFIVVILTFLFNLFGEYFDQGTIVDEFGQAGNYSIRYIAVILAMICLFLGSYFACFRHLKGLYAVYVVAIVCGVIDMIIAVAFFFNKTIGEFDKIFKSQLFVCLALIFLFLLGISLIFYGLVSRALYYDLLRLVSSKKKEMVTSVSIQVDASDLYPDQYRPFVQELPPVPHLPLQQNNEIRKNTIPTSIPQTPRADTRESSLSQLSTTATQTGPVNSTISNNNVLYPGVISGIRPPPPRIINPVIIEPINQAPHLQVNDDIINPHTIKSRPPRTDDANV